MSESAIAKFSFGAVLALLAVSPAHADWTPPPASPYLCPSNEPACQTPLNSSAISQIKNGALGFENTLMTFGSFFGARMGIGPGFITSSPQPLTTGVILDLDGQLKIKCPSADCDKKVLTSSDNSGLSGWQDNFWRVSASPNDIENTNSQHVRIKNGLGKLGSIISGQSPYINSHVNLGSGVSVTGGISGSETIVGATVSGGGVNSYPNQATNDYSTVRGGYGNIASGLSSVVGGGGGATAPNPFSNTASGDYATIVGGYKNNAQNNSYITVIGGARNSDSTAGAYATIGGGGSFTANQGNITSGAYSTILGGTNNTSSGNYSVVTGGQDNVASGLYSTIPGGFGNNTAGDYSLVGGRNMMLSAAADNTFLWGHSAIPIPAIPTPNAFIIYSGNVGIGTTSPNVKLVVDGQTKISTTNVPALEVSGGGGLRITQSPDPTGMVLTAIGPSGDAVWYKAPVSTGGSVMDLRRINQGASSAPACPASWSQAASTIENIGNSANDNFVRTCYTSQRCQVIVLKKGVPGEVINPPYAPNDPIFDTAPYQPASCPSGYSQAALNSVHAGLGAPIYLNRVRTCYRCF